MRSQAASKRYRGRRSIVSGGGGGKKLPSPAQFKEFLDFVGNVFTAIEISKLIKEYWPSITNEDLRAIGEYDLNLPYGAAN